MVDKILSTESSSVHQIFETKGKVYTYLNPVSYLTALDHKELFGKMDGIFADGGLLVKAVEIFRDDRWLFVIYLSCVQKYNFMLKQQKIFFNFLRFCIGSAKVIPSTLK